MQLETCQFSSEAPAPQNPAVARTPDHTWRAGLTVNSSESERVRRQPSDSIVTWVEDIATAWARGATGTLELARIVARARKSLDYGQWSQLWRSGGLPFSKRKGEMLVVIGKGVGGLDAQSSAHLPVAWTTLYHLARLGPSLITRLIDEGRVHPDLSLRDAQALVAAHQLGRSHRRVRPGIKGRLSRFAQFVRVSLQGWSATERQLVRIELLRLADQVALSDRSYQPRKS
jgi:hypothetical protein